MELIINEYKKFNQVKAIAIGGSSAANTSDNISDIDVYVFIEKDIPVKEREKIVKSISSIYEVGGEYFGAGDEYFVDSMNKQFDVMFWNTNWFESVVDNVWIKNYPSNGYTTAFLYTLNNFKIEYDQKNWLTNIQNKIKTAYPQKLKENIINATLCL